MIATDWFTISVYLAIVASVAAVIGWTMVVTLSRENDKLTRKIDELKRRNDV